MINFQIDEEIVLSEISFEDVEPIYNAIVTNNDFLSVWLPFIKTTKSIVDTVLFVQEVINSKPKEYVFAISYKNEFAGIIGTVRTDKLNYRTEIGYWLVEKMQNKGIIIRSLKILERFLFEECNIHRIVIRVAVENFKSNLVALNSSYILESFERDGIYINDGFSDTNVYAKINT